MKRAIAVSILLGVVLALGVYLSSYSASRSASAAPAAATPIKFRGIVTSMASGPDYGVVIVRVQQMLEGPSLSGEVGVGTGYFWGCFGDIDPDLRVQDNVEVFGLYDEYGVSACNEGNYIRRLTTVSGILRAGDGFGLCSGRYYLESCSGQRKAEIITYANWSGYVGQYVSVTGLPSPDPECADSGRTAILDGLLQVLPNPCTPPPPTLSIRVDRGDTGQYFVGEAVRVTYTSSRPTQIRLFHCQPPGQCALIGTQYNSTGDVWVPHASEPAGWAKVKIEAWENNQLVATAETNYFVKLRTVTSPPGGFCRVHKVSASTACSGDFGLKSPQRYTIFDNYGSPSAVPDKLIGPFEPGTALEFYLRAGGSCPTGEYSSLSASVRTTSSGPNIWRFSWEDLPPNATDSDYNDLVVDVECGIPPTPTLTPRVTITPPSTATPTPVACSPDPPDTHEGASPLLASGSYHAAVSDRLCSASDADRWKIYVPAGATIRTGLQSGGLFGLELYAPDGGWLASHDTGSLVYPVPAYAPTGDYRLRVYARSGVAVGGPYDLSVDLSLPPTSTSTPTPTYTATRIPTRMPTATLTPYLPANPAELRAKETLVAGLENPGFTVIGLEIPSEVTQFIPAWGYSESRMKSWLPRFRANGYAPEDLASLRRATLAEEMVQEYYGQALNIGDKTATGFVKAITSMTMMLKAIGHIENAAAGVPVVGEQLVNALQYARRLANAALNEVLNMGIDVAVDKRNPLNQQLKLATATYVDYLSLIPPTQLLATAQEYGGRAILDYATAWVFTAQTQPALDDIAAKAQARAYNGSDGDAHARAYQVRDQSRAASQTVIQYFDNFMIVAGIARTTAELGALVTIVTGGVSPLSGVAHIATAAGTLVNFGALGVGSGITLGRWTQLDDELRDAARVAFAPASVEDRLEHEIVKTPTRPGNDYPLGIAADTSVALGTAIQSYEQVLAQIENALRAGRYDDVIASLNALQDADESLYDSFMVSRAPVQAAIFEVGRSDPSYAPFVAATDDVAQTSMAYLGSRLGLHMRLIAYLMQGGGDTSEALASLSDVRTSVNNLQGAIQTARDAGGGIAIPGFVVVSNESQLGTPSLEQPFTILVTLSNAGGADALDVVIDVAASRSLQLQTAASYTFPSLSAGARRTIYIQVVPTQLTDGYVTLHISSRSAQSSIRKMLVVAPPSDRRKAFLPFVSQGNIPPRWEVEEGRILRSGDVVYGAIEPQEDEDTFYFDAAAGQRASVSMARLDGDLDSYLILYAPDGTEVARDDDSGVNFDAFIDRTMLPQTGRYRIVAHSFGHETSGTYALLFRLE